MIRNIRPLSEYYRHRLGALQHLPRLIHSYVFIEPQFRKRIINVLHTVQLLGISFDSWHDVLQLSIAEHANQFLRGFLLILAEIIEK